MVMRKFLLIILLFSGSVLVFGQDMEDPVCKGAFKQTVTGWCIGHNTLIIGDIDHDGVTEIVCMGLNTIGTGNLWYILEWDAASGSYLHTYVSSYYEEGKDVTMIRLLDADNDGEKELVVGTLDGRIDVVNPVTLETEYSFMTPPNQDIYLYAAINDALVADADNDGAPELVCMNSYQTYIYSAGGGELQYTLPHGGLHLGCGNVDADSDLEMVIPFGEVLCIKNGTIQTEWVFSNDTMQYVVLAELDGDGMQEILLGGSTISAWDADTRQLKWSYPSGSMEEIYTTHIDGSVKVIFGNDDSGDIVCLKGADGTVDWKLPNTEQRVSAIIIGDTDSDGYPEIVYGSCNYTSSDFLYIMDLGTGQLEWTLPNLFGPFTSLNMKDADNDGITELVTVSYSILGEDFSGILSVFDPYTQELEWQYIDNLSELFGAIMVEVANIDKDFATEIIIAKNSLSADVKIKVFDGGSHHLETMHTIVNFGSLRYFSVGDPDGDGEPEYIIATNYNVKIINPENWVVEWASPLLDLPETFNQIVVDNIDSDPAMEIILVGGKIHVFDPENGDHTETEKDNYSSFDIYDLDGNGIRDIVAGTDDGRILKWNIAGQTMDALPVNMESRINSLKVADIHGNAEPELVFMTGGRVWFSTLSGNMVFTDRLGYGFNPLDRVLITDFDGNGEKEVFAATSDQVTELGPHCYECVTFDIRVAGEDLTCIPDNDAWITMDAWGGIQPYEYFWSNDSTWNSLGNDSTQVSMQNLLPGTYTVTALDHVGCVERETIILEPPRVKATISTTVAGCDDAHPGAVSLSDIVGLPPYRYDWNYAGNGPLISPVPPGLYSVTITDSLECTGEYSAEVMQDSVKISHSIINPGCFDDFGQFLATAAGTGPFNFSWSDASGTELLNFSWPDGLDSPDPVWLRQGNYILTVKDQYGCSDSVNDSIVAPPLLEVRSLVMSDSPSSTDFDGSIVLSPSGGTPPYEVLWMHDITLKEFEARELGQGAYKVVVSDSLGCKQTLAMKVEYAPREHLCRVYPVPFVDMLTIDFGGSVNDNALVSAILYDSRGRAILDSRLPDDVNRLRLGYLQEGLYFLRVIVDWKEEVFKVEKFYGN